MESFILYKSLHVLQDVPIILVYKDDILLNASTQIFFWNLGGLIQPSSCILIQRKQLSISFFDLYQAFKQHEYTLTWKQRETVN